MRPNLKPKSRNLQGKLLFNIRGGARLIAADDRLIAWIADGMTGTALHGDTVEATPSQGEQARITRVIERAHETIIGLFQKQHGQAIVIPDDPRNPHVFLVRSGGKPLSRPPRVGDKVVLHLDPWNDPGELPTGRLTELLGAAGAPGVDMLSVIRGHDLPAEFPEACEREAAAVPDDISDDIIAKREDCRGQFVLTIDPDDAKDHDDAVSVERTAHGWQLTVHIADVAHYVRPGSALDKEARRRANSTYLVDRCIPMLPFRLSADLCSLRAGIPRLAHSVFFDITAQGKITKVRFAKTVIQVHARLTYKQAMAMIKGEHVAGFSPDVPKAVQASWQLASVVRKLRFAAGSLELDFPEIKIWLDAEGRADRMERMVNDESHQLVEEFMLLANEAVAKETQRRNVPCIYRIHEKPDPDRLNEFRKNAATAGLKLGDMTQRKEVMRMLTAIRGRPDEFRLKIDFLKSLRRAAYSPDPLGHYGLHKANYLHFTSPIRRYADLVAHRVLAGERGTNRKELTELSKHISDTERTSAQAEQESRLVKKIEFFQRQLDSQKPQTFRAIVSDTRIHGLTVELPDADTTGLIAAESLPNGPYTYDRTRSEFVNRRTKRTFKIGDEVKVIVCRVDAARRMIDFAPV
ncbi:ribonuclease R [Verrucomicrobiota bacterium]|nr:ribonuclease R [Verrucomicrobiota bacterium]